MMEYYEKTYTREGSIVTLEIWEAQYTYLKDKIGITQFSPFTIYHSHNDIIDTYFNTKEVNKWMEMTGERAGRDQDFTKREMTEFKENLTLLAKTWEKGEVNSLEEFQEFFNLAAQTWAQLSISYVLPTKDNVANEDKDLALRLRDASQNFLDDTNKVIENTLRKKYPHLNDLVKFILFDEFLNNTIPSQSELEVRKKEYIYFGFKLYISISLDEFASQHKVQIEKELIDQHVTEIKGQVAMKGKVTGKVRVLRKKSEINQLQENEILVTAMTTPDYLPAMKISAAFITDEGGITCHAAIVARELNKPCIIGTRIATKVLKDGDMVEVDAEKGIVRII